MEVTYTWLWETIRDIDIEQNDDSFDVIGQGIVDMADEDTGILESVFSCTHFDMEILAVFVEKGCGLVTWLVSPKKLLVGWRPIMRGITKKQLILLCGRYHHQFAWCTDRIVMSWY